MIHETKMTISTDIQSTRGRPAGKLYRVIQDDLAAVRERISAELICPEAPIASLCQYVARYQGKMLRPAVLLLSGKACGSIVADHVNFSAVIELMHLATLVHDDVLDEAQTRRRSPTIGQLWGNEPSVLLGDLLLSRAFDLCNRSRNHDASQELSQTADLICRGELLQCMNRGNWDLSEEQYLRIIEMKTASLYRLCGRLGARFAGAAEARISALGEYGRLLGCSFQIVDDLLDIVGREDQTGKTLGTDLAQGKPTLPVIHFRRETDAASQKELMALRNENHRSHARIQHLLEHNGSLEYSWRRARSLSDQAREQLGSLTASPARDALAEIAEFVVKRTG